MSVSVWRISFNGGLGLGDLPYGSTLADERWHTRASRLRVVYAAQSQSLCQLEKRVHANGAHPKDVALIRLDLPDDAVRQDIQALGALPGNWRSSMASTQALGNAWLASNSSLGLWVPSFVVPAERNLLINPAHLHYTSIVVEVVENPFRFDPRLF